MGGEDKLEGSDGDDALGAGPGDDRLDGDRETDNCDGEDGGDDRATRCEVVAGIPGCLVVSWSFEHSAARPEDVWKRYADVTQWSEWSPGVQEARLDGPFEKWDRGEGPSHLAGTSV